MGLESRDRATNGLFVVFEGGEGTGKAQPLSEPILTPKGWQTMGDIRPGDFVIGSNGRPARVLSVHPQGIRPIYKVTFLDGSSVRCDAEHLWHVQTRKQRQKSGGHYLKTTKEMVSDFRSGNFRHPYTYSVPALSAPVAGSVEVETAYAIGYLLGNGSFTGSQLQVTTHSHDSDEIVSALSSSIAWPSKIRNPKNTLTTHHNYPWVSLPLEIQKMRGLKGSDKTLPDGWLQWNASSRLLLLRGLMDADGGIAGKHITFSTKSEGLKQGVIDLVRSLGGVAPDQPKGYFRGRVESDRPEYNISLRTPMNCFSLSRKATLWENLKKSFSFGQSITDIKLEGDEEAQCILIDSEDHLYVTSGYKLTHNTTHIQGQANLFLSTYQGGILKTRHPGGTPFGQLVRNLLLHDSKGMDIDPIAEAYLFTADYRQHLQEVLKPAFRTSQLILCDRYIYSGVAYQGYGSGGDVDALLKLYRLATEDVKPDLLIWLDADPKEALQRARRSSSQEAPGRVDRLEDKDLGFHQRVRGGFEKLFCSANCDFPVLRVNTLAPRAEAAELIHEGIRSLINKEA
jgi:dTMP kinase